jgi:hypothetical protein
MPPTKPTREERLAQALRDNLRKRKAARAPDDLKDEANAIRQSMQALRNTRPPKI